MLRFYPWVVALAYLLPAMHQSSLGALMLLAGEKVHPLWQTPLLPLFYVWAAAYMGFACVAGTLLFCSLVWHRAIDLDVIAEMNKITANLIGYWLLLRFADIVVSRKLGLMFQANIYSGLFWMETIFLIVAVIMLVDSARRRDPQLMFHGYLAAAFGGMLYRFNPTTLAFQPRPGAFYFPSAIEILISMGFVALGIAAFVAAAKAWAILPGPVSLWKKTEIKTQEEKVPVAKISNYAPVGD
jgi:Ni/Fe-hydrogenase subunit HybB-like protein